MLKVERKLPFRLLKKQVRLWKLNMFPVEVEEEEPEEQQIFQVVEEMPEFPGGMAECLKFLGKNIKYPTISQENGVQGKVIVQFVVNKDGSIVDPGGCA